MHELTTADKIWNRACVEEGGLAPRSGDRALAALLLFHGVAMNGGVRHSLESCDCYQLSAAEAGYEFYGFEPIGKLISEGRRLNETTDDLEFEEQRLDNEYAETIKDDEVLRNKFIKHFEDNPDDYAPLKLS